ncbi:MAG: hypothetical protein OEZ25_01990 [Candidatus Bathyarchaeota archaeon]|nr:hypothetical protein [Candidatus Bathyarchaeota archaeon]
MDVVKKSITTYFTESGPENTDKVIEAVRKRVEEGDVKTVVVASTSGSTGAKFARALKGEAQVVAISYETMDSKDKEEIIELGGKLADNAKLLMGDAEWGSVKRVLYALGQGFKVAVQVLFMATEKGLIKPYEDVIGVAGSGRGSDTAIVAKATTSKDAFGEVKKKKLEVREIVAMPLKKRWY